MSHKAWERGNGVSFGASSDDEKVAEVVGRSATHRNAPPAHKPWGPEFWPVEIRENLTSWPPVFRERQLVGAVRTRFHGTRRVAFVSNKDGVGKSTAAQILRTIFTTHRTEPVAVLDANVDTLRGDYVPVSDNAIAGIIERGTAGENPIVRPAPGDDDYAGLLQLLTSAYPIILCDVGSGIGEKATREILDRCDQIVVVATPQVDGLYAATSCLDDLSEAGYGDLADNAICAINRIRPMPFSDLLNIDRHFSRRCREVIRVAWDSRATCENATHLDELRPTTRTGFFELAAAVARSFGNPPTTTKPREDQEEENR